MSDEEEERMVCIESLREPCTAQHHDSSSSSSSLRSLLIDIHKSFVNHFWQDQVVGWGHAYQWGERRGFLISKMSILILRTHVEKVSDQRSCYWTHQRHPPCPSWPGHSSCWISPPAWSEAGARGPLPCPSGLGESTPWICHRSASSPAEGGHESIKLLFLTERLRVPPSRGLWCCPPFDWVKRSAYWSPQCRASPGSVQGTVKKFQLFNCVSSNNTCNKNSM